MSVDFSARGRNAPSCRLGVAVGRFERRVLKGTRAALFAAMADARSWAGNWNETGVAVSHTPDRNYCSNKIRNVSDIAEVRRSNWSRFVFESKQSRRLMQTEKN